MIAIPDDLIPKDQQELWRVLQDRLRSLEPATVAASALRGSTGNYSGSHAQRMSIPAASLPIGVTFWETDRTVLYIAVSVGASARVWQYLSGTMRGTLSQIPTLLSVDAGFLFHATDYLHTWRWSGSAWAEPDQGDRSARMELFYIAPGTGWKLMDGTGNPVTYSTATAGTATITLPDARGAYVKTAAAAGTAVVAASGGALTGAMAAEDAHTHAIDHDHPSFTSAATVVGGAFGAGGFFATTETHTHAIDVPAYSGASGAGSSHTHGNGTLAVSASEPAHYDVLPYFRL